MFKLVLLALIVVNLLHFNALLCNCVELNVTVSSFLARKFFGQPLAAFTFKDGGEALIRFKLKKKVGLPANLFVMASDLHANQLVTSLSQCQAFFASSLAKVPLSALAGEKYLGRFSGPFPVLIVYADALTCANLSSNTHAMMLSFFDRKMIHHKNAEFDPHLLPTNQQRQQQPLHYRVRSLADLKANAAALTNRITVSLLNPDTSGSAKQQLSVVDDWLPAISLCFVIIYAALIGWLMALTVCRPSRLFSLFTSSLSSSFSSSFASADSNSTHSFLIRVMTRFVALLIGLQLATHVLVRLDVTRLAHRGIRSDWLELLAELCQLAYRYAIILFLIWWTLSSGRSSRSRNSQSSSSSSSSSVSSVSSCLSSLFSPRATFKFTTSMQQRVAIFVPLVVCCLHGIHFCAHHAFYRKVAADQELGLLVWPAETHVFQQGLGLPEPIALVRSTAPSSPPIAASSSSSSSVSSAPLPLADIQFQLSLFRFFCQFLLFLQFCIAFPFVVHLIKISHTTHPANHDAAAALSSANTLIHTEEQNVSNASTDTLLHNRLRREHVASLACIGLSMVYAPLAILVFSVFFAASFQYQACYLIIGVFQGVLPILILIRLIRLFMLAQDWRNKARCANFLPH